MVTIAHGKATMAPLTMFFKAIMCNVLVCLAVWIAWSGKSLVDKFFAALLPIAAVVAMGFEHCVANMFFLPMGLLLNALGTGAPGAVTLAGVVLNIVIVTIGNLVGGGILVGITYWFAYRKKEA
jgi:formate/nitrite transporter FocA (FNT family)